MSREEEEEGMLEGEEEIEEEEEEECAGLPEREASEREAVRREPWD